MVIRLAILLLVLAGGARAESLRLVVPDIEPVVGEMIPLTIRGEYQHRIALETLTFPDSDAYDWMQFARDSWKEERVEGRSVLVFRRHIALFPRRAGPLTIGPVTHRLTVVGQKDGGREPLEIQTDPLKLQVIPFPGKSAPLALRALTVEDELSASPGTLRDGETLIRKVTIRADGTLPHLLPPRPEIREPWLISFTGPEVREVEPAPDGPQATLVWEWHLRPKTGEPGVLPPLEIPWFDTVSRTMRTAEIPAIPFGYKSFKANRGGMDRLPAVQVVAACGVFSAGLVAGLAVSLSGTSGRRKAEVARFLRSRFPFDPTRRAVRSAARHYDLLALRAAAERYLARHRELGLPEPEGATAELDRALFAEPCQPETFNPKHFAKGFLRRRPGSVSGPEA